MKQLVSIKATDLNPPEKNFLIRIRFHVTLRILSPKISFNNTKLNVIPQ